MNTSRAVNVHEEAQGATGGFLQRVVREEEKKASCPRKEFLKEQKFNLKMKESMKEHLEEKILQEQVL